MGMNQGMWLAATLLAASCAGVVRADENGEWQLSIWGGKQNLRVDRDLHFRDESTHLDTWLNGISVGRRLPNGFLVEAAAETATHDSDNGKDHDFYVDHYSLAVGWQLDAERWRFTPKVGMVRSTLGNQARLLLNENGGRVFERNYTVPYGELDVQRRFGRHWQVGASWRETDEDFGHTNSWAFRMTILW